MNNTGAGSIELQAQAAALSEAIRDGKTVPRVGSLACPNYPRRLLGRHGRRGRHHGRATKNHHQLAGSRRPGPQPLPCSPPVPYRLYWRRSEITSWHAREPAAAQRATADLGQTGHTQEMPCPILGAKRERPPARRYSQVRSR